MSLKVSQGSQAEFELIPEGQYVARCFKVIDLGGQTIEWAGEEKIQQKVMISWEILDEPKMSDGRPFAITRTYTASLNENSHLFKDLVAWRGKAFTPEELLSFDISKLLGAYCQIQVIHNESNGRTFANVNAIMGTKERPKKVNKEVLFDINNPDMELFETFSDYLKGKIQVSEEWKTKEILSRGRMEDNSIDLKDIKVDSDEDTEDREEIDISEVPF